jgi:hypothetical protein
MLASGDQAGSAVQFPSGEGEVVPSPLGAGEAGQAEESMSSVKFAGSVTIPPSAYELAKQEAEMDLIRDMVKGNISFL